MNREAYRSKYDLIDADANRRKSVLNKKYALENNDITPGEFVTDHRGTILVEEIRFAFDGRGFPCCRYFGAEYTKAMKPRKDGSKRAASQANLILNN